MSDYSGDSVLIGVFYHTSQAERAYQALRGSGFRDDQVHLTLCEADLNVGGAPGRSYSTVNTMTGLGVGILVGGILGITATCLVASLLSIVLGAAVLCAAVGGFVGAVLGWTIAADERHGAGQQVHISQGIVTIRPEGRETEASLILHRHAGCEFRPEILAGGQEKEAA